MDSGFHHVEGGTQIKKLFRVRKTKHTVRVAEVPCARTSLNQGDCFLLDLGDTFYPWFGDDASPFERAKCGTRAHNVAISRHGHCKVKEAPDAAFWSALGGKGPSRRPRRPSPGKRGREGVLYKLSDSTGSLTCSEAKRGDIKVTTDLDSNDVFILGRWPRDFCVGPGPRRRTRSGATPCRRPRRTLHANNKPDPRRYYCANETTPLTNAERERDHGRGVGDTSRWTLSQDGRALPGALRPRPRGRLVALRRQTGGQENGAARVALRRSTQREGALWCTRNHDRGKINRSIQI